MALLKSDDVFDMPMFYEDVNKYRIRWRYSKTELAKIAGVDIHYLMRRKNYTPSLRAIVLFAKICDLDLNKYIKEEEDET